MLTIDTHCHASPSWYEPIDVLLHQMDRHDVDHSVLVQHGGMYDNGYLLECADRHPDRVTPVVLLDPGDGTPRESLTELAERGAGGVRLFLDSPLADPGASGLWEHASDLGLPVSVFGTPDSYATERFERLLDACDPAPVVVEHLGGINRIDPPYDRNEGLSALLGHASRGNLHVKVPGLGEFHPRPGTLGREFPFDSAPGILGEFAEAFGAERLMWGSDFPPCSSREGYANTLAGLRDHAGFTRDQLEWVLGRTAASVWGVDGA